MKNSLILTAVTSNLTSKRDKVLVQLDLILNKNVLEKGMFNVVEHATELFIELSTIESALETVKSIIDINANPIAEQISEITTAINKLQENNNLENNSKTHGDNS